jgi:aldose 1-epimerase
VIAMTTEGPGAASRARAFPAVYVTENGAAYDDMRTRDGRVHDPERISDFDVYIRANCPDSPNRPEFPSTVLRPGGVFASTTVYRLSVVGKGEA